MMADTLAGITGDFVPPGEVLNPWFLVRLRNLICRAVSEGRATM